MAAALEPLDLVDIAVLLNYERATTDERFRHAILDEVAYPGNSLRSYRIDTCSQNLNEYSDNARTRIVLEQRPNDSIERDLPSTMLTPVNNCPLTPQQLETVFYQVRAVDACGPTIELLQVFFSYFPTNTKLRIRHAGQGKEPGRSYVTQVGQNIVIEDTFIKPKFSTLVVLPQANKMVSTGHRHELVHAALGFKSLETGKIASVLDLASMQFGDVGRGPGEKGKMLFALDTMEEFEARLTNLAEETKNRRLAMYLASSNHDVNYVHQVAQRVKERWEERVTEKWCAYCGAPKPNFKCAGCGDTWFCNKEHQKMAWSLHKGYCNKG